MTRFIVLRSLAAKDGKIIIEGLVSITQKSSGAVLTWMNFSEANTNWIAPEKCDLLSFSSDDKYQLEENLEFWGVAAENVVILGVEENVDL